MADNEKLANARRRLSLYYAAEEAVLQGQEYRIGSKSLVRADLKEIRSEIEKLEKEVSYLSHGGKNKCIRGVPYNI